MAKTASTDSKDRDHNLLERNGHWYIRYKLAGGTVKQSLDTTDVKQARKRRDQILKAVADQRERIAPPAVRTWQEAVDGRHASLEAKARAGQISPGRSLVM